MGTASTLAHRQRWQDVIGEMRRRRHHAPGVARRANAAPLAGERDQEVVPALAAAGAGEAVGEDAAVEIAAELPLHVRRHRPVVVMTVAALGEPGLEVLLDAAIEHAPARSARPILRRCAVRGPALDPHARPLCAALRRWGSAWAARCACRHWPQGLGRAAEVSWLNTRRRRGGRQGGGRKKRRRFSGGQFSCTCAGARACRPGGRLLWRTRRYGWLWPKATYPMRGCRCLVDARWHSVVGSLGHSVQIAVEGRNLFIREVR